MGVLKYWLSYGAGGGGKAGYFKAGGQGFRKQHRIYRKIPIISPPPTPQKISPPENKPLKSQTQISFQY